MANIVKSKVLMNVLVAIFIVLLVASAGMLMMSASSLFDTSNYTTTKDT